MDSERGGEGEEGEVVSLMLARRRERLRDAYWGAKLGKAKLTRTGNSQVHVLHHKN